MLLSNLAKLYCVFLFLTEYYCFSNIKIEDSIDECSPCFIESTTMISEDIDKIVKHEKDLLDDGMWESTMEIQKSTNQNNMIGPINQVLTTQIYVIDHKRNLNDLMMFAFYFHYFGYF